MADDNRSRILDLAVAAIDRGGEAAVRVNHIVAEVGVTPPVLYYHFGSAYARPELAAAITAAQDTVFAALVEVFEPCRQRGWLCAGIDLVSVVAWHYSLMSGRIYIEHGTELVNPDEWDRLTLEALMRAFFGE